LGDERDVSMKAVIPGSGSVRLLLRSVLDVFALALTRAEYRCLTDVPDAFRQP